MCAKRIQKPNQRPVVLCAPLSRTLSGRVFWTKASGPLVAQFSGGRACDKAPSFVAAMHLNNKSGQQQQDLSVESESVLISENAFVQIPIGLVERQRAAYYTHTSSAALRNKVARNKYTRAEGWKRGPRRRLSAEHNVSGWIWKCNAHGNYGECETHEICVAASNEATRTREGWKCCVRLLHEIV